MKQSVMHVPLLAGALLASSMAFAHAATLSFAQYGPDRGFQADVVKQFAEDVKTATNGEVQVRVTFGGALIDTRDVFRGVSDGVADLGSFIAVYTPAELFNFRVGDLPIGNPDPWVGTAAMQELYETNDVVSGEFENQGTVLIANFTATEVVLICREPVDSLDKFQGMKMRANPPHSLAFEEFGAAPVSVAITDVYQSLDRGLITCAQTYIPTIVPYRHYEVAKHITTLDFGQNLAFGVVMNKRSFERLTPEQQEAVEEAGRKLTEAYARESVADIEKSRAFLEKEGVTFHTLSAEDDKRLKDAGQVTVDAFLAKGDKGVLDAFRALGEKYSKMFDEKGYPWAPK